MKSARDTGSFLVKSKRSIMYHKNTQSNKRILDSAQDIRRKQKFEKKQSTVWHEYSTMKVLFSFSNLFEEKNNYCSWNSNLEKYVLHYEMENLFRMRKQNKMTQKEILTPAQCDIVYTSEMGTNSKDLWLNFFLINEMDLNNF